MFPGWSLPADAGFGPGVRHVVADPGRGGYTPGVPPPPAAPPRRPPLLSAALLGLAVANLFGLYLGVARGAELRARFPRLEPFFWLYVACPVATLLGLWLLWTWRRAGLVLVLAVAVVVFALEAWAMGPGAHLVRVPVAAGLLLMTAWPVRGLRR